MPFKTKFALTIFALLFGAAADASAKKLEDKLGFLPRPAFLRLPDAERARLVHELAKVVADFEKSGPMTDRLNGRQDSRAICSKAGWIFFSAPGLPCDLAAAHRGCEKGEIRCASWTGRDSCVAEEDGIAACLDKRTPAELRRAERFFEHEIQKLNWIDVWETVRLRCTVGSAESCARIHALAETARKLSLEASAAVPPAPSSRREPHGRTAPAWVRWIRLLIEPASCATCGMDADGKAFTKKGGDKVHYLFEAHGDIFGTRGIEEQMKSAKDEDLKKLADGIVSRNAEALKIYRNQAQTLKDLAEAGKIEWVGLESLPEDFRENQMEEYRNSWKNLEERLRNAGHSSEKIDDLRMTLFGPYVGAAIKQEPWAKKIRPTPIDNDGLKSAGDKALRNAQVHLNTLKVNSVLKKVPPAVFDGFENFIHDKVEAGRISPEEYNAQVAKFPKNLQDAAGATLDLVNHFIQNSDKRDVHAANRLLSQSGNGAIVMGSAHKPGVTTALQRHCGTGEPSAEPAGPGRR